MKTVNHQKSGDIPLPSPLPLGGEGKGEGETPAHLSTTDLNVHSHTGKIGRLPSEIRNQLARGLREGIPAVRLVAWLNSLPEVQAILASDFGGRPINEQNLSKWKVRGYPDWLQEQAFMTATVELITKNSEKLEKLGLIPRSTPQSNDCHA